LKHVVLFDVAVALETIYFDPQMKQSDKIRQCVKKEILKYNRPSLLAFLLFAVSTFCGPENKEKPKITRVKTEF
jgi:hypothetical protein